MSRLRDFMEGLCHPGHSEQYLYRYSWRKLTQLSVIWKSMDHSYICNFCEVTFTVWAKVKEEEFNLTSLANLNQLHWQILLPATVDSPVADSDLGCCGWWWQGWGEEFVASCFLSFRPLPVVYFLFPVHLCCPSEVLFSSDKHLHSLFYLHDRGK